MRPAFVGLRLQLGEPVGEQGALALARRPLRLLAALPLTHGHQLTAQAATQDTRRHCQSHVHDRTRTATQQDKNYTRSQSHPSHRHIFIDVCGRSVFLTGRI